MPFGFPPELAFSFAGIPTLVIVPSAILGKLDYLLREHLGIQAEIEFIESLISGAFTLENLTSEDVSRCHELITSYRNLELGLGDAAVIATAERLNIHRILTVDERDFRAVRSKKGGPSCCCRRTGNEGTDPERVPTRQLIPPHEQGPS